ncbi:MAG TPA: molybdenum cofactor guanylyltransferase [Candidatus Acidoferrales bacterium]|nr:molybdenum cofactor guanylyltransferase [Candidatus Acidoferrales bacterium]
MGADTQVGGFVMAGGQSSRMGRDKALLEIDGVSLLVHAANLLQSVVGTPIVVASPGLYGSLGLRIVADDWPGYGPLGGIATALRASTTNWNLIIACDLPYLTKEWLEFLVGRALKSKAEAVVPMNERGAEPLCAMYHKNAERRIRAAVESGVRKVTGSFAGLRVEYVEPDDWKAFASDGLLFKNMNSPADYEEAKARLSAHAKL